jgi:hypothetical protein
MGFIWKVFSMEPITSRFLWKLGIGGLTLAIDFSIPFMGHTVADILIRSAIITNLYGVLVLVLRVSDNVN